MFLAVDLKKYRALFKTVIVLVVITIISVFIFKRLYPLDYTAYILEYSGEYGLDPVLVCGVINAESGFDKDAVSKKGAKGLMQIMETTAYWGAEEIGIDNFSGELLYEPGINIQIGCWYLSVLMEQYGDTEIALAAYNAGSGNVSKWLRDEKYSRDGEMLSYIPYEETRNYISRVKKNMIVYKHLIGGSNEKA